MGRRFALVLLLTFAWYTVAGAEDLRRDELRCEEAVQRISDCCGNNFDAARVDCTYVPPGCNSPGSSPQISESEADRIFDESCDAVAAEWRCGN
jgi:hypothetical protein